MLDGISSLQDNGLLTMVTGSGPVVKAVLFFLIFLSVCSWAITIAKTMQFRKAQSDSQEFSTIFWETRNFARIDDSSRRLESSPLAKVFLSGYRELLNLMQEAEKSTARPDPDNDLLTVERALKRAELVEALKLERGITFLANVASAGTFIGLFGTVWGIMNAFHNLKSVESTTIQAVAPGISEALVATAIGLAAAIPAQVASNYFSVGVRHFRQMMDSFSSDFINVARRNFIK